MNYVIIGMGYIAPRHLKAIKDTGGTLLAAVDPHDAVGVLDSYFPGCDFFTEFELFDRHCEKLKRDGVTIHYVIVCSPNYLHDAHCRWGLRFGADVICEKPVTIFSRNVDALQRIEEETGKKVFTILQMRLHPDAVKLKERLSSGHYVDLNYVTPRGKWYAQSWKGNEAKSGGIITNIGIHLFDLLLWLFGDMKESYIHENTATQASGVLQLDSAKVMWRLSLDGKTQRSLLIDREPVDLTNGFTELHTKSYEEIIAGRGFGLEEAKKAIELVNKIRCVELQEQ